MILAAGLGTRLQPLTYFRAKAAVPFLNLPLISYSVDLFRQAGIEEAMVNLHHLPDTVKGALAEESSVKLHFSLEDEILGTAGCLRRVSQFLGVSRFVISNGKTYFEQDLAEVVEHHERSGALVTMVLVPYSVGDPYNPVLVDSNGFVAGFARNRPRIVDKQTTGDQRFGIYTGVQILEPEVLDWIPPGVSDSVNDIYPRLMNEGHRVLGFMSSAFWAECSTPQRYLQKSLEVLALRNRENLSAIELPRKCHGAVVGNGVQIWPDTAIENSVIWGDTKLGANSSFRGVIITDGVAELPADTHLSDVIVTPLKNGAEEHLKSATIADRYAVWPIPRD